MNKKLKFLLIGLAVAVAAAVPAIAIASNATDNEADAHHSGSLDEDGSIGTDGDYDPNTPDDSHLIDRSSTDNDGSIGADGDYDPNTPGSHSPEPVEPGHIGADGSLSD